MSDSFPRYQDLESIQASGGYGFHLYIEMGGKIFFFYIHFPFISFPFLFLNFHPTKNTKFFKFSFHIFLSTNTQHFKFPSLFFLPHKRVTLLGRMTPVRIPALSWTKVAGQFHHGVPCAPQDPFDQVRGRAHLFRAPDLGAWVASACLGRGGPLLHP